MSEPIRSRSRIQPAATMNTGQAGPRHGNGDVSWMKTGEAGEVAAAAEVQRQAQLREERARDRAMPWRFWLGAPAQADIIILDDGLPPRFYEHEHFNQASKKTTYEACPGEWENCPLCDGVGNFKGRNLVQLFSIIDLRPYKVTNQKASDYGQTRNHSKRLLCVKIEQQAFFKRLAERNNGKLRGAHLLMSRDTQTIARIGNPEFIQFYDEETLLSEFGHPERLYDDGPNKGKVAKQKDEDAYPYNYGVLFPKPSGEDLRIRYGGQTQAGSRRETQSEWGNDALDPGHAAPTQATGQGQQTQQFQTHAPEQTAQPRQGIQRRSTIVNPDDVSLDDEIPF